MTSVYETDDDRRKRARNGRLAITLSLAWWVISIGGIIYVINTSG